MEPDIHAITAYLTEIKANIQQLQLQTASESNRVIYTAIFGDFDLLNEPLYGTTNDTLICFSNNKNLRSSHWRIVYANAWNPDDSNLSAKVFKLLPHLFLNGYKEYIWIDGSVLLTKSPWGLIDEHPSSEFLFFVHPHRTCIYKEIDACIAQNKVNELAVQKLLKALHSDNYPQNHGLIAGGFIYRKNSENNAILFTNWMRHILEYGNRDQLTFNYICWKNKIPISYCPLNIFSNPFFMVMPHSGTSANSIKRRLKKFYAYLISNIHLLVSYVLRTP